MIAAQVLGVPYSRVKTAATATDKIPNTQPTAASSGSDLNGWAVFDACKTLCERLGELRGELGEDTVWEELIKQAYLRKIDLSAHGHYAAPDFVYNYETKKGRGAFYWIWAAALCEVCEWGRKRRCAPF